MRINTWQEGLKMEPDSSQWYPLQGQEAMGMTWNTGNSILTYYDDGETVEQVSQRRCRIDSLGDILNQTEHSPE